MENPVTIFRQILGGLFSLQTTMGIGILLFGNTVK
jgi:hypothetical protein